MKTRKTQFLLFALMAFFFFAGNVNAEGTERVPASSHEMITEPELEIQDWMLEETYLTNSALFYDEMDQELNVEKWMVNHNKKENNTFGVEVETEKELEIESWMLNSVI